jgi:hypothetical protein
MDETLFNEETEEEHTTSEEYKAALEEILDEQVIPLLCQRNAGYGSGNLLEDGHMGIAIRMKDKCARIIQLSHGDDTAAAIEDAYLDLIGYAVNGLLIQRGKLK